MSAGIDWTFGHGFPPVSNNDSGDPVAPSLIALLQGGEDNNQVIDLIKERDEFGKAKHGQSLSTSNGRCTIDDASSRFGDLLLHLHKGRMNGEDMSSIKDMLWALERVLE